MKCDGIKFNLIVQIAPISLSYFFITRSDKFLTIACEKTMNSCVDYMKVNRIDIKYEPMITMKCFEKMIY